MPDFNSGNVGFNCGNDSGSREGRVEVQLANEILYTGISLGMPRAI